MHEPVKQNAGPAETKRVRALRKAMPLAERKLWQAIRGCRLDGWKFRRQVPIEGFAADFACYEARLVIELDGESHDAREAEDAERTRVIEGLTFRVIRFKNEAVLFHFEGVLRDIVAACRTSITPSP